MTLFVNNAGTDLVLSGIGVQPYSARGLTQTMGYIAQAVVPQRTVNGKLKSLVLDQFKKYTTTISGDDVLPPVCEGVWPGKIVTVDCVVELSGLIGAPRERTEVPDSGYEQGGFYIYRPRLIMMVMAVDWDRKEYERGSAWNITLEESE